MAGQHRAEFVRIGNDIDHTGRKNLSCQSSQHERRHGCRGRRLKDEGVAEKQCGGQLIAGYQHREIPRCDRRDHAKRLVMHLDAVFIIVLENFRRQFCRREVAQECFRIVEFQSRFLQRLSLFPDQYAGQIVSILVHRVGEPHQQTLPLRQRYSSPMLPGGLGGGHRLHHLLPRGPRNADENSTGRRIDDVDCFRAVYQLAVDEKSCLKSHFTTPDHCLKPYAGRLANTSPTIRMAR